MLRSPDMRAHWIGMLASLVISLVASHGRASAHTPRRAIGTHSVMALPHNRIYNGTDSGHCAWPTAVLVLLPEAICTGTLVHPNIVVYAAHCGTDVDSVLFGEDVRGPVFGVGGQPRRVARPDYCNVYPGHDPLGGTDFAYCKLADAVTDVPVVPVLMGCEQAALRAGKEVVMVGFGQDQDDNVAIKEEVRSTEGAPASLKVFVGGDGNDTCFGDSGGPVFVQLTSDDKLAGTADNSWRVFALTSYGLTTACGDGSFDSLTYLGVPWIEQDSGVDITPCFDAYGHWDPGPACGQFPVNPGAGGGTWANGCSGAPAILSGAGATCGAAYDPVSPMLTFTSPGDRAGLDAATPVEVMLRATDAQGGTLSQVHLAVDGVAIAPGQHAPPAYHFNPVTLAPGTHTLTATGRDAQGNTATSRLTVLVSDDDATSGAGCAACGEQPWAAAMAGAWAWACRRRRPIRLQQRSTPLAMLLCATCLQACGAAAPEHVSIRTVSGGAQPRDVIPPAWGATPKSVARLSGAGGGMQLERLTYAVFGYRFEQDDAPALLVALSDQADVCSMLQQGRGRPGAQTLLLELTHTDIADEDQPTTGAYSVTRTVAEERTRGRYVLAGGSRQGVRCRHVTLDDDVFADAGSVSIATGITHTGAFVFGTLAGLRFGDHDHILQGEFVAEHCPLGDTHIVDACY